MWVPTKRKKSGHLRSGWYCLDTSSGYVDPLTRRSGKQAAQNTCRVRNAEEKVESSDSKKRNPRKWYTVGYFDDSANLERELSHYHGYGTDLLSDVRRILLLNHVPGAHSALIWPGRLTYQEAVHGPVRPWHRVSCDGEIS